MDELLVAILSMLLVVALIPLYLWKRRQDSRSPGFQHEEPRREVVVRATGTSSAAAATIEESVEQSDDEAAAGEHYEHQRKKKRNGKRGKIDDGCCVRVEADRTRPLCRDADEEREVLERRLEEEAEAQKAREEEAAALEFEKWKGEFSADDEGTLEEVQDGNQDLLANFVEYIKDRINRITSLESIGRLSGVVDDRGKYIYISQEMKAVADFVKRQGRISISHLASKSNQFIDLEPKTQHIEDMTVEEITVN